MVKYFRGSGGSNVALWGSADLMMSLSNQEDERVEVRWIEFAYHKD
jgi:hypothetical protein